MEQSTVPGNAPAAAHQNRARIGGLIADIVGPRTVHTVYRLSGSGYLLVELSEMVSDVDPGSGRMRPRAVDWDEYAAWVRVDYRAVRETVTVDAHTGDAAELIRSAYADLRARVDHELSSKQRRDEAVLAGMVHDAAREIASHPASVKDFWGCRPGTEYLGPLEEDNILLWVAGGAVRGEAYPPHVPTPHQPRVEPWAVAKADVGSWPI